MKTDIDALMQTRNLDALVVWGLDHNPAMVYLTGGRTDGCVFNQKRGAPVLFHYPMERDEAARTGLRRAPGGCRMDELRAGWR
jgi:hypothetical protein